jgi:hypothetical protein
MRSTSKNRRKKCFLLLPSGASFYYYRCFNIDIIKYKNTGVVVKDSVVGVVGVVGVVVAIYYLVKKERRRIT